ncbi:MAG: polyprenyl synthetase family protein, partial [Clostridiales bacterium]|nr:polyprenyl synthetase family protein [Clostridiales bacterium]
MDNKTQIATYRTMVNDALPQFLPDCHDGQDVVTDAMRYSLMLGGKRIRPVLTLAFAALCGADAEAALPLACAVEMVHTYSLIHDDLPCMDDDSMRRGQLACHVKFGEATALLAGDALLTQAFYTAADGAAYSRCRPQAAAAGCALLAREAGVCGMIGGQVLDLDAQGKEIAAEALQTIHRLNTCALIRCACQLGCIAAQSGDREMEAAALYGEKLGLAFQIQDDILDANGDEAALGKPVGSDAENGKCTYVT